VELNLSDKNGGPLALLWSAEKEPLACYTRAPPLSYTPSPTSQTLNPSVLYRKGNRVQRIQGATHSPTWQRRESDPEMKFIAATCNLILTQELSRWGSCRAKSFGNFWHFFFFIISTFTLFGPPLPSPQ
jgi:hypothetical protein